MPVTQAADQRPFEFPAVSMKTLHRILQQLIDGRVAVAKMDRRVERRAAFGQCREQVVVVITRCRASAVILVEVAGTNAILIPNEERRSILTREFAEDFVVEKVVAKLFAGRNLGIVEFRFSQPQSVDEVVRVDGICRRANALQHLSHLIVGGDSRFNIAWGRSFIGPMPHFTGG